LDWAAALWTGASHSFKAHVTKVGTTGAPFLTIGVGARANAMGGAFVSVANDVTAIFWNPAGIASLPSPQLALIHSDWIADLRHDFIGVAVPLGSFGVVGASVNALSMDDLAVRTTAYPEGTGDMMSCGDLAMALTYGFNSRMRIREGATGQICEQQVVSHACRPPSASISAVMYSTTYLISCNSARR
jgi:hypothetical protein